MSIISRHGTAIWICRDTCVQKHSYKGKAIEIDYLHVRYYSRCIRLMRFLVSAISSSEYPTFRLMDIFWATIWFLVRLRLMLASFKENQNLFIFLVCIRGLTRRGDVSISVSARSTTNILTLLFFKATHTNDSWASTMSPALNLIGFIAS